MFFLFAELRLNRPIICGQAYCYGKCLMRKCFWRKFILRWYRIHFFMCFSRFPIKKFGDSDIGAGFVDKIKEKTVLISLFCCKCDFSFLLYENIFTFARLFFGAILKFKTLIVSILTKKKNA